MAVAAGLAVVGNLLGGGAMAIEDEDSSFFSVFVVSIATCCVVFVAMLFAFWMVISVPFEGRRVRVTCCRHCQLCFEVDGKDTLANSETCHNETFSFLKFSEKKYSFFAHFFDEKMNGSFKKDRSFF